MTQIDRKHPAFHFEELSDIYPKDPKRTYVFFGLEGQMHKKCLFLLGTLQFVWRFVPW